MKSSERTMTKAEANKIRKTLPADDWRHEGLDRIDALEAKAKAFKAETTAFTTQMRGLLGDLKNQYEEKKN